MRILIATSVRLYREGLAHLLSDHASQWAVDTASPGPASLTVAGDHEPNVILADADMVHSTDFLQRFAEAVPEAKLVALALREEQVEQVLACVEAGAFGFVEREASITDLVAVIEAAARGEVRCSPRVAGLIVQRFARAKSKHPSESPALTPRETEIICLIDDGLSNKEIARRLGIEVSTVKNHIHHILTKLHVQRRAQAAAEVRRGHLASRSGGSRERR